MIKYLSLAIVVTALTYASQDIHRANTTKTAALEIFQEILPTRDLHAIILGYLNGWSDENMFSQKTEAPVNSLTISPNGRYACGSTDAQELFIFNLKNNGSKLAELELNVPVSSITFSSCSKYIAAAFQNKTIQIWDLEDKLKSHLLEGHEHKFIPDISFSPDSNLIASGCWDNKAKLWKKQGDKYQFMQDLLGHTQAVLSVKFSSDGQHIATGSRDGTLKIWHLIGKQYELRQTLDDHADAIRDVVFSPKAKTIASYSWDQTVKLWQFNGQKYTCVQTLTGPGTVYGQISKCSNIVFSPDGFMLMAFDPKGKAILWGMSDAEKQFNIIQIFEGQCYSMVFSADGNYIAMGINNGVIQMWKKEGNSYRLYQDFRKHQNLVAGLCCSPDNLFLVSGSDDCSIKLWKNQALEIEQANNLAKNKK